MSLYKDRYRVESTRLRNWDYFIIICTNAENPEVLYPMVLGGGILRWDKLWVFLNMVYRNILIKFGKHLVLNCGNVIIMNILYGMKTNIIAFQNI